MKLTVPSVLSVDFEWQQSWWWIFFVNFHDVVDSWMVDSQSLSVCQHDYILNDCVFLHPVAHKKSTKLNHGLNIEAPTVYMNIDKTFGIVCNSNVFDSIIKSTQNELNIYPNDTNIDTLCVCFFSLVLKRFGRSVDVCDHFVNVKSNEKAQSAVILCDKFSK